MRKCTKKLFLNKFTVFTSFVCFCLLSSLGRKAAKSLRLSDNRGVVAKPKFGGLLRKVQMKEKIGDTNTSADVGITKTSADVGVTKHLLNLELQNRMLMLWALLSM